MSSSVIAHCKTIDKMSIMDAAERLKIAVSENANRITFGSWATFECKGNQVDIKLPDFKANDKALSQKRVKKLVQLGTYIYTKAKLKKAGLNCTTDIADAVLAVNANQPLNLEFEEEIVSS